MSKQLHFTYEGKEYVLEYTRKSVERMEASGFMVNEINDKPMTMLPRLFAGAFMANHPYVSKNVVDGIFAKMKDRTELIGKLTEMYNEPISALVSEPEEDSGNVEWTASW